MKPRALSLILALALCLGLSPWLTVPARAAEPVRISSAEDLIDFARRVNSGETDLDAVLTADIALGVYDWKAPIYEYDYHDSNAFRRPGYTGTFDGGGHRIYGIISDHSIFGKIGTGGVVRDLTVDATSMHSRAVLAYCCTGTISNCHVSGTLYPEETGSLPRIGGIAAELGGLTPSDGYTPGTIVDCTSDVEIHFYPSRVENYGHYELGGIVGTAHDGTIDHCFFSGSIELQGEIPDCSAFAGGIVGIGFSHIINCGNSGSIHVDVRRVTAYDTPVQAGGIVGQGSNLLGGRTENCWNTGNVQVITTGAPAACSGISGGMKGYVGGLDEIRNCWSSGTVTVTSDSGDSAQEGSDTCYFLEGTNYNSGTSPTFTEEELYNGVLTDKLNEYVRSNPDQGLLSWVQGPWGPELSDSCTPPESSAFVPATPVPSTPVSQTPNASGFVDVPENQYYYEPVIWAVQQGITTGTSPTTFSPDQTCSKGEILTFLWRAAGSPEPEPGYNPFFSNEQIREEEYYFKPLVWALSTGALFEDANFNFDRGVNPKSPCTRAAAVYYIWATLDHPEPDSWEYGFMDLDPNETRLPAIVWAAATGITTGTGEGTFSPNQTCTRGQIVTFLYRAFHQ